MNLDALLKNVDKEKLKKLMADPAVAEKLKNVDLSKLMSELSQNPELLAQIKKFFS